MQVRRVLRMSVLLLIRWFRVRPPGAPPAQLHLRFHDHASQLAELTQSADTVLRREYGGYQLRAC